MLAMRACNVFEGQAASRSCWLRQEMMSPRYWERMTSSWLLQGKISPLTDKACDYIALRNIKAPRSPLKLTFTAEHPIPFWSFYSYRYSFILVTPLGNPIRESLERCGKFWLEKIIHNCCERQKTSKTQQCSGKREFRKSNISMVEKSQMMYLFSAVFLLSKNKFFGVWGKDSFEIYFPQTLSPSSHGNI